MILFVDNFDSFTYNLVQCFQILHQNVRVIRNTASYENSLVDPQLRAVVIGPGPGNPDQAGNSMNIIAICLQKQIPLLGVCLGHQCVAQYCKGSVVRARAVMHGKSSLLIHQGTGLFKNVPSLIRVIRYHSLVVDPKTIPQCLEVLGTSDDHEIMALQVRSRPVYGIQFHPESIKTEKGLLMLQNFLSIF